MPGPNPRVRTREKFELSLDGRQVASIVVGALVVIAAVFVLGLNVGKQLALRFMESRPAGDLEALDRAPSAAAPAKPEPLTFHDRLTKESPARPPPPDAPAKGPPPAAAAPTAPPPATGSPPPAARSEPPSAAAVPATPAAVPAPATPGAAAATRPWTVQLAAASDRTEAERVAARFASLNPRVEEAIVPGKGRFFRVRVGSFDTKEDAQRYLRDVGRETGAKGIVVPSR